MGVSWNIVGLSCWDIVRTGWEIGVGRFFNKFRDRLVSIVEKSRVEYSIHQEFSFVLVCFVYFSNPKIIMSRVLYLFIHPINLDIEGFTCPDHELRYREIIKG